MDSFSNKSIDEFTGLLFSKAPVPGGGGAAALVGALGVSLGAMAANLTVGKKKYAAYEAELQDHILSADKLRSRLLALIDADAEAFEPLSKAYSMPKDTADYDRIMQKATLDASLAPYEMMKCCCEVIEILEKLIDKCSPLMISDVGCGAVLAGAALKSASLNVFVNVRMLKGQTEAELIAKDSVKMLAEFLPRADSLADFVLKKMTEGI